MSRNGIRNGRWQSPMVLGGALVGGGIAIGMWIAGAGGVPYAMAAPAQDRSDCLPAISVERNELVLLKDQSGIYFLVDTAGNVAPLRITDTELRDLPGKTLLRSP